MRDRFRRGTCTCSFEERTGRWLNVLAASRIAPEGRQILAHGVSRGLRWGTGTSPGRGDRTRFDWAIAGSHGPAPRDAVGSFFPFRNIWNPEFLLPSLTPNTWRLTPSSFRKPLLRIGMILPKAIVVSPSWTKYLRAAYRARAVPAPRPGTPARLPGQTACPRRLP